MIKLTLTLEEAILLRDAIADKKCALSMVGDVIKPVSTFTGRRKEMILSCIDLKTMLNNQIVRK
jgi:hypothetical protein